MDSWPTDSDAPIHGGGLAAAVERGALARTDWTSDGTLLSAEAFAARRGVTVGQLEALEARGEVFALEVDNARWYPAELLRVSPDDAAVLCAAAAGLEPSQRLVFLIRRHGALGGVTASAAIADGGMNRVLALVSAWLTEAAR